MALAPGMRLGAYEVVSLLGQGGMGEVYRAKDTKLNRDVALKILPDSVVVDPERVARFTREAQVLATLNHPHIGAIYGLEDSSGVKALVLELVEGPTLADRIARGPLPIAEALGIARQIADALETAHEKGIVHRDLKPANIALTADDQVKVLDFGLAKAMEPASAIGPALTASPTITTPAMMTGVGMILGTAAYMSPEQAKGRPADKRSDVWAFGCVLYEMLTGTRAFAAEDVSDTLAAVLRSEPDWSMLPAAVPLPIRVLLKRCLRKDQRERFSDLSAARVLIEETPALTTGVGTAQASVGPSRNRWRIWAGGVAIGVTVVATAVTLISLRLNRADAVPKTVRFELLAPSGVTFARGTRGARIALSPDGTMLAFAAYRQGQPNQIWLRRLDSVDATPLPGTDDVNTLFWSPDSRFIGFFAGGKLKKTDIAGGSPLTLCDNDSPTPSGTWNREGVILFSAVGNLRRVSAEGGESAQVVAGGYGWPYFLPDGRHFLTFKRDVDQEKRGAFVGDLNSTELAFVAKSDSAVEYAEPGFLLFIRGEGLYRQPFDPRSLKLQGEAVRVAQALSLDPNNGRAGFAVAGAGALVYATSSAPAGSDLELTVFDRAGSVIRRLGSAWQYRGLSLSHDGKRAAAHRHNEQGGDIWIIDIDTGTSSRLTFAPSQHNASPVWSPDDTRIAFTSLRNGSWGVYQKAASGVGSEQLVFESRSPVTLTDWVGDLIVVSMNDPKTGGSGIWWLATNGRRTAVPFLTGSGTQASAQLSADGRWLAYVSPESGKMNIYVQSFPTPGSKYQVSTDGGIQPRWRRDGRELLFAGSPRTEDVMTARVERDGDGLKFSPPVRLMTTGFLGYGHGGGQEYSAFALSADGQRLVTPVPEGGGADLPYPLTVVLNWAPSTARAY